ncbi:MAG: hypothetical protein ABSG15_10855 [FCB group bacterium]|jgi:hypothetical protein
MSHDEIINRILETLAKLPSEKAIEVADFADFLLNKSDDDIILQGIRDLTEKSISYDFLKEEEDLYNISDLKERYK